MIERGGSEGKRGKQREAGLGSVHSVPLSKAREIAAAFRAALVDGKDPIELRRVERMAHANRKTFGQCVESFLEAKTPSLRNAKHRKQWRRTLEHYAADLWDKPVDEIDASAVCCVLLPIWQSKPETASRLRMRIENVLAAATVQGLRHGNNPANWRGNLDKLLPKPKTLSKGHRAAMSYHDIPAFIASLRGMQTNASLGLEFCVLTAARTAEVTGARWIEIDSNTKIWTVPAARMKASRPHRVPLTDRPLAILEIMAKARSGDFIFPGQRPRRGLSDMAFLMLLRHKKVENVTTHGFRSSFRDWCGDATDFPREVAEAALSHVVGDKAEQAYRRGEALDKRRALMQAWAEFCDSTVE